MELYVECVLHVSEPEDVKHGFPDLSFFSHRHEFFFFKYSHRSKSHLVQGIKRELPSELYQFEVGSG